MPWTRPARGLLLTAVTLVFVAGCAGPPAGTSAPVPATPAPPTNHAAFPVAAPGTATWAPWPSALHDARHSGASTGDGPTRGTVRWRRKLEGPVTPGPVVGADGTIYVASNGGVLHALNPATGRDRWTYDAHQQAGGADLSSSPLVLPGGTVLFPAGDTLTALSPAGARLWTHTVPGTATSPVSADGKRVYLADTTGTVTALDVTAAGTATTAWQIDTGGTAYSSVVTDGHGRIYTTADSGLVALDDLGGSARIAWRADPHDGAVEVSPGLAPDGTVLLGTNGKQEWAYRPDGTPLWHAPRVITYSSPAVTATGLGYVADHAGLVHVFATGTGREPARYGPVGTQIWSSTVVDADYRVYFGGQNGHVYGFDAHGHRLFDVDIGGPVDSYPALTGTGLLVIGSGNGYVTELG